MTIRVVVADDQALFRETLALLIGSEDDMEVVAEVEDGAAAFRAALEHRPHVVLMDIRMPGTSGVEGTAMISEHPDLVDVHVLILTTFEVDEHVAQAIRAGAGGFIGKGIRADALVDAVRTVARGESLLSPLATRALIARFLANPTSDTSVAVFEQLTPREREVVVLVAMGRTNDEIAAELVISAVTAKTHVNRAMTKLGARDRAQLVVLAYQCGLVVPGRRPD
ncbi:DNA-binding NarL/FixJ family response regulator [Rhodococcus sp. 27YEA15]|uniref:response regulator transcription factor n=1 Tax=Rhodococcus sp. 27YEA15 TaxID=3156259 RepID=UPI003C7A124C